MSDAYGLMQTCGVDALLMWTFRGLLTLDGFAHMVLLLGLYVCAEVCCFWGWFKWSFWI